MFKKHFADILWYIGIGFISWAVSHWFFTWTRSIIMALLWIILFTIHQYLKEERTHDYMQIILFGLIYSLSIGMISWWLQHFLDSPTRSLWIIPVWYFISYLIFGAHMKSTTWLKNLNIAILWGVILAIVWFAAYKIIPMSWYSGIDGHHGHDSYTNEAWYWNAWKWQWCWGGMMWDWKCAMMWQWWCWGDKMGAWECAMMKEWGTMWDWMLQAWIHDHGNITSEEQFIVDMIPHHQEAVDTSIEIVARSSNEELRKLAQWIIDAQKKEIAMMQNRLKEWYPSSILQTTYKNMMPDLKQYQWVDLDNQYLMGMVMHHKGAVQMAQWLLKLQPRTELIQFANDIIRVQTSEINQMKVMLQMTMPDMHKWDAHIWH